jgi:glucose/arabinose dehydrogenase
VLSQELDIRRLAEVLKRMRRQKVAYVDLEVPSPFALPLMVERFREKLSTEKLKDRLDRMLKDMEKAAVREEGGAQPRRPRRVAHELPAGLCCGQERGTRIARSAPRSMAARSSMTMRRRLWLKALALPVALVLAACGETAKLPLEAGVGPNPQLPQPNRTLIPTVDIARATGWPEGAKPVPAAGLAVTASRAASTTRAGCTCSQRRRARRRVQRTAEGGLRRHPPVGDEDGDEPRRCRRAERRPHHPAARRRRRRRRRAEARLLQNLYSPFGMALVGNDLYVAMPTRSCASRTRPGDADRAAATKVVDLPGGPLNHHWTKNIIASRDGSKLYATVGSNSNVGEAGMAAEEGRAAIWEVDPKAGTKRLYATGLRNPNGLAWQPRTGVLWTVVNERDELGSDLVPDYLTSGAKAASTAGRTATGARSSTRASSRRGPSSSPRR